MPSPRPWVIAAAGALATLLLLAIHVALDRTVGPTPHFVLLFTLPVLLAAWWGGAGPGLSTLAVSGLVLGVHGVTAQGEPALLYHADPERLGLFVLIGLLIVATFSQLHRAQSAAARSARVMRAQLDTVVRIASEREAVERQLAEGQARQQALIEALPQLIWTCRDDGWCDYLSPQWIAYTGIPEAEQLGYGWAKSVHPDDREAVLEAWDRAVQHAATFDVTFRIRSGAGAYRWFKTRAVQVMAADGTRTWFGTNTDIHDLRSAEEALRSLTRTLEERVEERTRALRSSEQRFRAIFHAQFQFIGLLSPGGILLEANQTALAAVGATADQVLGRPFDETAWWIHDAQQQERLRDAMRRAAAGEQVRFESTHPTVDGSMIWLDISITPFHDEQGQVVLLIPEGRDITARKASERALQLQEERFRSAFEHAPIGFALVSPDGRWLRVNEALCQLVGHDENSLLATTFQHITHPDDLQADLQLVQEVLAGRMQSYQIEKRYRHRDGHWVPVLLSVSLVRDGTEQPLYFIAQILDISPQKRAEAVMRSSLTEKELLLKEIHHRVKNNLQVVSTLLDLQADFTDDPHTQSLFAESRGRVRSMALIHERLYRSQDLGHVPVRDYIAQLAQDLYHSFGVSDTAVRLRLDVSIPPLALDVAIPCGLLINELMSNCFKHAFRPGDEGAIAVLFTQSSADTLCLQITDDGQGMPAAVDPHHAATFGLQLVQTLVDQLHGTLTVSADPVSGRGTAVTVHFPAPTRNGTTEMAA